MSSPNTLGACEHGEALRCCLQVWFCYGTPHILHYMLSSNRSAPLLQQQDHSGQVAGLSGFAPSSGKPGAGMLSALAMHSSCSLRLTMGALRLWFYLASAASFMTVVRRVWVLLHLSPPPTRTPMPTADGRLSSGSWQGILKLPSVFWASSTS